jgi:hypothetical protein
MKTRGSRIEDGGWQTRSVLPVFASLRRGRAEASGEGGECGSPLPLSLLASCLHRSKRREQRLKREEVFISLRFLRDLLFGLFPAQSASGLAQSKTWRQFVAATRQSAAIFPNLSHRRFPKRRYALLALLLSTLNFQPSTASAQPYSIDWSTIDGGGGTSTGGVYSVTGTIGQPDAGAMSGGNYTLQGGFWGIIAAVQTAGAPWLTITLNSQLSTINLSWPSPADGWTLEYATVLTSGTGQWTQIPPPYQTNVTNLYFTEPQPAGNRFYRLHKP